MKKAIIYARVSPHDKRNIREYLKLQKDKMQRFCNENGIDIVCYFEDISEGWSEDRPAYSDLIKYLKEHRNEVNFFFVSDWDRLSTDPDIAFEMIMELATKCNVTPQATEFFVDYDNPNVMEMITFQILYMPLLADDLLND
jgi:DNA invertase Pin-like site-specific DNA recombinase